MKHLMFFSGVFVLVLLVLLSYPTISDGEFHSEGYVLVESTEDVSEHVCCSFDIGGKNKTCAVQGARTCDPCFTVCGART